MFKVTFDDFSQRFSEEIGVNLETLKELKLTEIPEFDSMGKINISLLIEELFDFQIEYEDLNTASSVEELYNVCVENKK